VSTVKKVGSQNLVSVLMQELPPGGPGSKQRWWQALAAEDSGGNRPKPAGLRNSGQNQSFEIKKPSFSELALSESRGGRRAAPQQSHPSSLAACFGEEGAAR
jgi:hypothetical protein